MQGVRQTAPGQLAVPAMEPGVYSLCSGARAVGSLREGQQPPAASCATGVLPAHGELLLQTPKGDQAEDGVRR